MSKQLMVITIDGPPAAGKSTAASALAKSQGFVHLNSGALYRSIGLLAKNAGVSLEDGAALAAFAKKIDFKFVVTDSGLTTLLVNGKDISAELRNEQVGELASKIGALPELREVLTAVQRNVSKTQSVVLEGRDAGTVVFPDATFKFYLDASIDVRARRRLVETESLMRAKGVAEPHLEIDAVRRDMETRDERDRNREVAPLAVAADAITIDTTGHTIADTVRVMEAEIEKRRKAAI